MFTELETYLVINLSYFICNIEKTLSKISVRYLILHVLPAKRTLHHLTLFKTNDTFETDNPYFKLILISSVLFTGWLHTTSHCCSRTES